MASRIVELFSLRRFDFSALTVGVVSMEIVVIRQLRVVDCVEATLLVRVHALTLVAGTIDVRLVPTSPSVEDPSQAFVATAPILNASVTPSVGAPGLLASSLASGMGGHLRLSVLGTRTATVGSYSADLSAALVCKE
jgi:hypothetical protein